MLERNRERKGKIKKTRETSRICMSSRRVPQDYRLLPAEHCQTHYFAVIGKPESSQTRRGEAPKRKCRITGSLQPVSLHGQVPSNLAGSVQALESTLEPPYSVSRIPPKRVMRWPFVSINAQKRTITEKRG